MTEALTAHTALGTADGEELRVTRAGAVTLRELAPCAMVDLRLDPRDRALLDAAQTAFKIELPLAPKCHSAGGRSALWLGPDEWLIVAQDGDLYFDVPAGMHISVVDVSDLRALFELSGAHAIDVLRKGCSIDFHPRAFCRGDVALTAFARIRIALHQVDETPRFHLYVERSYATYLWEWLIDAMIEFQ